MWFVDWFRRKRRLDRTAEQRLKILAVSIWLNDRVILEPLCRREGWEVRFTNSPRDAFRLVKERRFDVVLCDSNQPGFPWREVMERIVANSPNSRILLVSPANDDYLWSDVVQQGGHAVLMRPLREADTLHAISAAAGFLVASDSR